jgi:branched-chain amino acid transport system substrate-binding protein
MYIRRRVSQRLVAGSVLSRAPRLLLVLVLLLGVARVSAAPARFKGDFVLGVGTPLTGSEANYGIGILDAIKMAAADTNGKGGVLGYQVKVLPFDTKGDPATGVAGAHYFISQNVNAVIGFFNSDICVPTSSILLRAHLPLISDNCSTPKLAQMALPNFVRITGDDAYEGYTQGTFARQYLHAKTASVLQDEEIFGQAFADAFVKRFKQLGGTIVSYDGVPADGTDFSSVLTKIKSLHPDVLEFSGFFQAAGLIVKQARQLSISSTYLTDSSQVGPDYLRVGGAAAIGSYLTDLPNSLTSNNPVAKAYNKEFQAKYHLSSSDVYTNAYDAFLATQHAVQLAKSIQPADLLKVLHKVSFLGATGQVSFLANGDRAQINYVVDKVLTGGTFKPVYHVTTTLK